MNENYDAILIVSFGGPEGPDDVMPFLENVLRGRNVPRERMLEVAEHYQHFGGVSPINQQNRELIAALKTELEVHGPHLPIYWGNRNWQPYLQDTIAQMKADGVRRALAFVTSVFSSYSGCRQYRENILQACDAVGDGAPQIDKLRTFFNHPGFIAAMVDRVQHAIAELHAGQQDRIRLVFTAHSIPQSMAETCAYTKQLSEACRLVSQGVAIDDWDLVYQSRSGPPTQPWLEPDICDFLRQVHEQGTADHVVVIPIGFVSDHMEVLYDLDTESRQLCDEIGLSMIRAKTAGTHPQFISMIRELILERVAGSAKIAIGEMPPGHDVCPQDCCPSGRPAR